MTVPADPFGRPLPAPDSPRTGGGGLPGALRWAMVGVLLLMVISLSFGLGFITNHLVGRTSADTNVPVASVRADGSPDFRVLDDIYATLRDRYVDPDKIDPEQLRSAAISGVITAVGDTHQTYVNKSRAEFEEDDITGQFQGIGAYVDQKGGEVVIVRPFDDSPAKKAGVRPGDVIVSINGEAAKGLTVTEASRKIRGPAGSTVRIEVRHSDGKVEELAIVRDRIQVASVKPDKPQDAQGNVVEDVAYVRIEQFTLRTPTELKQYLQSIEGKPYKGLILDLRNNPGGVVEGVVKVAEQFYKNEVVLVEQFRGGRREVLKTGSSGIATDMKIVVLVNRNSASASEVLSGALRDHGRATIVGETTFGKGTVNQFFDLSDGGKLYVTVGRWLTPKGAQIEGVGIKPDIEVKVADNENPDPREYFNSVMFRAVDLLRTGS
ncbi:MAG: S41 family peptidase [Dehalococcoidia bacterium]